MHYENDKMGKLFQRVTLHDCDVKKGKMHHKTVRKVQTFHARPRRVHPGVVTLRLMLIKLPDVFMYLLLLCVVQAVQVLCQ